MQNGQTLLIGDEWTAAASARVSDSIDPATGEVVVSYSVAGDKDVAAAVDRAADAFADPGWRALPPAARAKLLFSLADLIEAHGDELAALESRDQGQPMGLVAAVGVPLAAEQIRYNAGWCTKLDGVTSAVSIPDTFNYTRREPVGVALLLPTWNFPLMSVTGKLSPAIAAGNTVVIKPADHTPATALRVAELAQQAGFPPGVINVLTGDADTARDLVAHPAVTAISFTGSSTVGRDIAHRAIDRFPKLTLELGGKSASIVTAAADIDAAVAGNLQAALLNSGQVCAAYSRFLVHESVVDEFTEKLSAAAAAMVLGPGLEPTSQLGPLISQHQVERVAGYVAQGRAEGAELVTGGSRPDREGFFFEPTVFTGVRDDMTIAREEIFGPVMSVLSYGDEDEAVARANSSEFQLAAAVWTRELATGHRLAQRLDAGAVYLNLMPVLDPAVPWGGFGSSGTGKEMGYSGVLDFTREKSVWVSTAR